MKKIGLYTSPHLRFVRERIQIDNQPLSEEKFTKYFFETWDALEAAAKEAGHPNPQDPSTKPVYFRFLTLMAFHAFLKEQVHTAVIECGIGGEYDSTNVLTSPSVTGITSLGIDHTAMLGDTIEEIAWHKGGILKPDMPAYTVQQADSALEVLEQRAKERNTKLYVAKPHPDFDDFKLGLDADFQKTNAGLAIHIAAAHLNNIKEPSFPHPSTLHWGPLPPEFVSGLEQVRWPGRCEIRHEQSLTWYIDGGHTLESIALTGSWFASRILPATSATRESHTPTDDEPTPKPTEAAPTPSTRPTSSAKTASPPSALLLPRTRVLIFNQQVRAAPPLARSLHALLASALRTPHPFTHVVFCTNTTFREQGFSPDLVSVNVDAEEVGRLSVQKELAEVWRGLDARAEVRVVRTIEEAVGWARGLEGGEEGGEEGKVRVLVTGSLHLVGGLIDVLESEAGKER
ncbi:MAG: hypothetical protein Q9165_001887 [Trypethelium subeluteriae]